jgi:DNA-binding Lrp family transcriptional regulator
LTIDEVDLKILAELVENAKASFVEIGRKLHLHPNVVAYRINKMEQAEIIRGYTVTLDLEKLGLSEQVYIGASFPGHSDRDRILKEIAAIPQTVKVVSSLGSPESIILLVGKNKAEVDGVISKIRDLNIKIEYTASIIKNYQDGRLGNFLKLLAEEAQRRSQKTSNTLRTPCSFKRG